MAYKRRTSQVLTDARQRSTSLKAISPPLNMGAGLTIAAFDAKIQSTQALLDAYNTLLAQADAAGNNFSASEKELGGLSGRMLAGVGAHYGKDSNEYEMAGGTRSSEIDYHPNSSEEEEPPPAGGNTNG